MAKRVWQLSLWTAAVVAGVILMRYLAAQSNRSAQYRTQHTMPAEYAFGILFAFSLFALGIVMAIRSAWALWREYRRSHGHFTKREQTVRLYHEGRQAAYSGGWQQARQAAACIESGQPFTPLTVWGIVLHEGETAYFDVPADYARYYGGDGSYQHVSGFFYGSAGFVGAGLAVTALGNAARRNRARAEAMTRWREHQPVRVIVTDQRLICQADGQWLSFYYNAVSAIYPEPASFSLVMEFPRTSPMLLSGPSAALLSVYAVSRLHGAQAVTAHPALAVLTAV